MDKLTVDELERLERFTSGTLKHHLAPGMIEQYEAALKLAKLALSPPSDVAGLVSELRGLAEKATNEPWEQAGEFVSAKKLHGSVTEIINVATCERPEDAAYLVSAQPANMTKLLDCVTSQAARIRGLEGENARLNDAIDYALTTDPSTRSDGHRPTIRDVAYTAFMKAKDKNDEDGGATDWFTDTLPVVIKAVETMSERTFRRAATLQGGGDE